MKRNDIQSLRGFAVVAVVLFHFFPEYVPNGFLGVDQFFVVSGFLMAMLFFKTQWDWATLFNYIYRRIKRIVPMYLLVTWLILLSLLCFFPMRYLVLNEKTFLKSIVFLSNTMPSNEMSYYEQLNQGENLFTHTWSLSVEMQFFLTVPLMFILCSETSLLISQLIVGSIAICSYAYYNYSDKNTAFNALFCRYWQFTIGTLVFLFQEKYDNIAECSNKQCSLPSTSDLSVNNSGETRKTMISRCVVSLCFAITITDFTVFFQSGNPYLRETTTFLTGIILFFGPAVNSVVYTNKTFVLFGNVSYALYLVHWPIVVYLKLFYPDKNAEKIIGLLLSFCAAYFLTEMYEQWYTKTSGLTISLLLSLLILMNGVTFYLIDDGVSNLKTPVLSGNINMSDSSLKTEAMLLNQHYIDAEPQLNFNENCSYLNFFSKPFGKCNIISGLNPKSELTGMIIGNSYAANLGNLITENCGMKFKTLKQDSQALCEPLVVTKHDGAECEDAFKEFLREVRKDPPDYLFILARWISLSLNPCDAMENSLFDQADQRIAEFSKIVRRKIFVLDGIPTPRTGFLRIFNERLRKDGLNAKSDDLFDFRFNRSCSRTMLARLATRHKKMILLDIEPFLTQNGTVQIIDQNTGVSYFTGSLHISPHGEKQIIKVFQQACDEVQD